MSTNDKIKQRGYAKRHYEKNKKLCIQRTAVNNAKLVTRNQEYLLTHLKNHPCLDCGEIDPIVLEFDHVSGNKFMNVSDMARKCFSLIKIQEEIDKCEIRCANCHRRVTYHRAGRIHRN